MISTWRVLGVSCTDGSPIELAGFSPGAVGVEMPADIAVIAMVREDVRPHLTTKMVDSIAAALRLQWHLACERQAYIRERRKRAVARERSVAAAAKV